MRIPRFWITRKVRQDVNGKEMEIDCSGWSFHDAAEAAAKALERADAVFRALREGRDKKEYHLYLDRPVKEEIVGEYDAEGAGILVTRTGYGSLVLNTDTVMFIDIDEPEGLSSGGGLMGALAGLFGGKRKDPKAEWLEAARAHAREVCAEAGLSMRLYRTSKGLRGLVTDRLFKTKDPATVALLNRFRADELYVRLCRAQDCFRARLTPKPWRCDALPPPAAFPYGTPAQEARQREWEGKYAERIKSYATCAFLETVGNGAAHPAAGKVAQLHDGMTRSAENLPLA